jgi:hypothetical protein
MNSEKTRNVARIKTSEQPMKRKKKQDEKNHNMGMIEETKREGERHFE